MSRPIRIMINGFGRIGRSVLRLVLAQPDQFQVVRINDIAPLDSCVYLFQYDSVFGPYPDPVRAEADGLTVKGQHIPVTHLRDISHLTVVLGANDHHLADQMVVSNASCTTNALAPLLRVLDDAFGVHSGHMTTVHCYTGSQPTVDAPRGDLVRSRAAALSMVPTTTSAGKLIGIVLPHLAGRIEARAIRVPTASVSAIDLAVQTVKPTSTGEANDVLFQATRSSPYLGWITEPLVSTDLRARPESLVISGRETSVSLGGTLRVFGWYDNEWGFSNRMLDVAKLMVR